MYVSRGKFRPKKVHGRGAETQGMLESGSKGAEEQGSHSNRLMEVGFDPLGGDVFGFFVLAVDGVVEFLHLGGGEGVF